MPGTSTSPSGQSLPPKPNTIRSRVVSFGATSTTLLRRSSSSGAAPAGPAAFPARRATLQPTLSFSEDSALKPSGATANALPRKRNSISGAILSTPFKLKDGVVGSRWRPVSARVQELGGVENFKLESERLERVRLKAEQAKKSLTQLIVEKTAVSLVLNGVIVVFVYLIVDILVHAFLGVRVGPWLFYAHEAFIVMIFSQDDVGEDSDEAPLQPSSEEEESGKRRKRIDALTDFDKQTVAAQLAPVLLHSLLVYGVQPTLQSSLITVGIQAAMKLGLMIYSKRVVEIAL